MLNSLIWVIAIIVLNGVVASLAKKAQAKAEAARQSGAAGATQPQAPSVPTPDAARQTGRGPRVLARGGGGAGGTRGDRAARGRSDTSVRSATPAKPVAPKKPAAPKKPTAPMQDGRQAAASSRPPAPPAAATATQRGGDSAGALLSRQHLDESVARVRAAEAKISGLPGVDITPATARSAMPTNQQAVALAAMLRDPAQVRRAFVLAEVLGRPRAERPN
jgi:hypothetical protein